MTRQKANLDEPKQAAGRANLASHLPAWFKRSGVATCGVSEFINYCRLTLCLILVGCATHKPTPAKESHAPKDFVTAMQMVLDDRNDIRQIISHPPRTATELNGPAQGNPNALLFKVQDFAQRLQTIPLTGCPEDFKLAFGDYVAAWLARAGRDPEQQILNNPSAGAAANFNPATAQQTETAWQKVLAVQAIYNIKTPAKEF